MHDKENTRAWVKSELSGSRHLPCHQDSRAEGSVDPALQVTTISPLLWNILPSALQGNRPFQSILKQAVPGMQLTISNRYHVCITRGKPKQLFKIQTLNKKNTWNACLVADARAQEVTSYSPNLVAPEGLIVSSVFQISPSVSLR